MKLKLQFTASVANPPPEARPVSRKSSPSSPAVRDLVERHQAGLGRSQSFSHQQPSRSHLMRYAGTAGTWQRDTWDGQSTWGMLGRDPWNKMGTVVGSEQGWGAAHKRAMWWSDRQDRAGAHLGQGGHPGQG